jgi:hypothetical protein
VRSSLVLAVAFLAACSRGPGAIHVSAVQVAGGSLAQPLREAGIDEAALEGAARAALSTAGFASGEGRRTYRAEVNVVSVRLAPPNASGGPPRVEISVEVALSAAAPAGGGAAREIGTADAPLGGGDPGTAWRAALTQAAQRAADGLVLAFAEEGKPIEKVIADLQSKDARVRDHAVRVLADRRSAAAVPGLIARLQDDDPRIVHRAVGALAQIGDERAVGPLIELSRTADVSLTGRIARLIGDIGGAEAEGYLLTLEAGHPDPRVRRAAREALGEMRARADQAGALSARK